jgi:hypothetical protein
MPYGKPIGGYSLVDAGHGVLDLVGLIPFVGEAADGANAVWYVTEGDWLNAGLSAAALVPFAGWASTATKLGGKVAKNVGSEAVEAGVKGMGEIALKAPKNPKLRSAKELETKGIDAHQLKRDTLGRNADMSKYDIYVDKDGSLWLLRKDSGEYIPTYETL